MNLIWPVTCFRTISVTAATVYITSPFRLPPEGPTSNNARRGAMCALPWATNWTLVSGQPVGEEAVPRTCPHSSGGAGWNHRHRGCTGEPKPLAKTVSCVVTPCGLAAAHGPPGVTAVRTSSVTVFCSNRRRQYSRSSVAEVFAVHPDELSNYRRATSKQATTTSTSFQIIIFKSWP
jgi:hypothetical protein